MMFRRPRLAGLPIVALLLASTLPAAPRDGSDPYYRQRSTNETGGFQYDESKDVPWQEDRRQPPPPPAGDAALGELKLDSLPKAFGAYLDTATLDVSPTDRVLRYWLVVRSGSAATISYEGVNCSSAEYKVYAFADPREPNGVRTVREPRWQALRSGRSDFREELAESYLCSGANSRTPADVIGSIRGYYQRQNPFSEYTDNTRPQLP